MINDVPRLSVNPNMATIRVNCLAHSFWKPPALSVRIEKVLPLHGGLVEHIEGVPKDLFTRTGPWNKACGVGWTAGNDGRGGSVRGGSPSTA